MKIGIFGGTFDPPHLGHLGIATSALNAGLVDRVIFVPTSTPPHKSRPKLTSDEDRLKMTEIMIQAHENLSVSDIEIERKGVSYTYLTIQDFQRAYPEDSLRLIIGADMAITFDLWVNSKYIIDNAPPLIAARPGYHFSKDFGITTPKGLPSSYRKILLSGIYQAPLWDISSTGIRNLVKHPNSTDIMQFLDKKVCDYIISNNLYV